MQPAAVRFALTLSMLLAPLAASAQVDRIELPRAKFATGDDPARSAPGFDDSAWVQISTSENYERQGFPGYDGWSWYRIHVRIPAALRTTAVWQGRLTVYLSRIDDVDETFFNGVRIGQTGRFPTDSGGYDTRWQAVREYYVDLSSGLVRWDEDNVIAILRDNLERLWSGEGELRNQIV